MTNGRAAERLAECYLRKQGVLILERNWRCRFGEIDLIAREGDTLLFVEVRLRSALYYGGAAASIDHYKQKKLQITALCYLKALEACPVCRFDAVAIDAQKNIHWLKNILPMRVTNDD